MRIIFFLFSVILISCVSETESVKETKNQDPIVAVSELIDKDITNDSLYVERAKINIDRKRFKEALKDLNQANSLDSTKGETNFLLGETLLELTKRGEGNEDFLIKASKHFYSSVQDGFNLALSYKNAGEIFMHRGMTNKDENLLHRSIQLYEESIRVNATNPHTFILLGYSYNEIGRVEEAINCFNKSIELNPNNEEAYLQLGNLYYFSQDSTAIKYYKKVVDINPENRIAWYNLGLCYHSNSMFSESQDAYHKIIEFGIKDKFYADANYNLALMFMDDLQDYKNALNNYLIELVRVSPNYYLAYFRMAICYQALGDVVNAEQYYKRTLEINPDYKEARDRLNRLISDNEKYK